MHRRELGLVASSWAQRQPRRSGDSVLISEGGRTDIVHVNWLESTQSIAATERTETRVCE